ncbi:hypothetical protein [Halorubrum sp. GN11_10-6_MGM]|uniref:hypothetical protein n=1 Tax=Halorubrum sp. GN11_10-6_MGM TaxID=2518112 RepID=UPI0018EE665F|nr:hypothetical protein [Halorubrum sp. GN11_10-6_MGM]
MPVSLKKYIRESYDKLRSEDGSVLRRIIGVLYYFYVALFLTVTKHLPYGTNVYDRNWDALIILDACRVDAIKQVEDEYEFIESVGTIQSVGSTSFEWMPKTFNEQYLDEVQNTAYISGNPYTDLTFRQKEHPPARKYIPFGPTDYNAVDPQDFTYLEELWKHDVGNNFNRACHRIHLIASHSPVGFRARSW